MDFWQVPRLWAGQAAFIICGGPSVAGLDLERLRDRRVIAINSSYQRAPWADFVYSMDKRWLKEHRASLAPIIARGGLVTDAARPDIPGMLRLKRIGGLTLPSAPDVLSPLSTSLEGAIQLAVHLGAERIVLVGADGGPDQNGRTHHHTPHRWPNEPVCWSRHRDGLARLVEPLKARAVKVVNASPATKWADLWPVMTLDQAIAWANRELDLVRVFVGCAPNGEDAESQAVLEWSLRKHASLPVELIWLRLSRDPASWCYSDGAHGWQTETWATPFSGLRWIVPLLCGWQGRAIYCDSDFIFRADVAELWRQEFWPGKAMMTAGGGLRTCISVWDCEELGRRLPPGQVLGVPGELERFLRELVMRANVVQPFAGDWNCFDGAGYADLAGAEPKAIHYTDMRTQPQLRHALPRLAAAGARHWFDGEVRPHPRADLVALFDELLAEAHAAGFAPARYLPAVPYGAVCKRSLKSYSGRRHAG